MNIYDFTMYVNQDVDDTFTVEEIARWFNKAIANFNLIPPVTKYPFINMDNELTTSIDEFVTGAEDTDGTDGFIGAYVNYPFSTTFMLAVMLPYVVSAVKGQEASVNEKQLALQEFIGNGRTYKATSNIATYLQNQQNTDLGLYQLGENVFLTDFTTSPFAGEWGKASSFKEVTIATRTKDDIKTTIKYVNDSYIDEDVDALIDEVEGV
jgi:hypothetical protein